MNGNKEKEEFSRQSRAFPTDQGNAKLAVLSRESAEWKVLVSLRDANRDLND